jgi:VanZ family protein
VARLPSRLTEPVCTISLGVPVVFAVVAATAIPIEWRPGGQSAVSFGIEPIDLILNVLGYIPVGLVLAPLGSKRAVVTALLCATFAESSQLVMLHRDSSVVDVAANVLGAFIGALIARVAGLRSSVVSVSRLRAITAGLGAVVLGCVVWVSAGDELNPRGVSAPGSLEAQWSFEDDAGRLVRDSSGRGLDGVASGKPTRGAGQRGDGIAFDGVTDWIRVAHGSGIRVVRSLTIAAWIKPASNPVDDAAIVSTLDTHYGYPLGYQLDTTIDKGRRTLGFKLGSVCGSLMARYGASTLALETWYHVAGVYDAEARTIDVYVNGERDNGALVGPVSSRQRSSRQDLYVARRSDLDGFGFSGTIDDVQIYSRALGQAEIRAMMGGSVPGDGVAPARSDAGLDGVRDASHEVPVACSWSSEREDARIPAVLASVGVLLAISLTGGWPSAGRLVSLPVAATAGVILWSIASPTLPRLNLWLFPMTSTAGATAVVLSIRTHGDGHPH